MPEDYVTQEASEKSNSLQQGKESHAQSHFFQEIYLYHIFSQQEATQNVLSKSLVCPLLWLQRSIHSPHMPLHRNVSTCNCKCQSEIHFHVHLQTQPFIISRTKYFKQLETKVITSRKKCLTLFKCSVRKHPLTRTK